MSREPQEPAKEPGAGPKSDPPCGSRRKEGRFPRKVLVANRGEIAVRIMRTLREMGISAVAVHSDEDHEAPHVAMASEAVALGDSNPSESYLCISKLVEAAQSTGADAVHPGYGFLSESPAFARALTDAGLTFIGPPPAVMELFADKTAARRLMEQSGVPVIPGTLERAADSGRLVSEARRIGFPLLVKAALGGGGKGMRIVDDEAELEEAVARATSEAEAAFGDGSVYLERKLHQPRHIEIQVLADSHGNVVHLFERECSLQRRHQKVIEETPSPALDQRLRERMCEDAVTAVRAAGYVGAGTVEFLLDEEGRHHFLEVNARLQVEHPITELCTGMDLVRRQVEIAAGRPLPFRQEDILSRGHAIECRIYAEDPEHGLAPSPGRVLAAEAPQGPGVRFDSGITAGSAVPVHYDPILAKIAVHAEDRPAAIARMLRALEECAILGVATPIELLISVMGSDAFRSGATHTELFDELASQWSPDGDADRIALLGHQLEERTRRGYEEHHREPDRPPGREPAREADSPWRRLRGFGR